MHIIYQVKFGDQVSNALFKSRKNTTTILPVSSERDTFLLSVTNIEYRSGSAYILVDIAPIAQSVNALDFNFERAVEGSIFTAGKRLSLKI